MFADKLPSNYEIELDQSRIYSPFNHKDITNTRVAPQPIIFFLSSGKLPSPISSKRCVQLTCFSCWNVLNTILSEENITRKQTKYYIPSSSRTPHIWALFLVLTKTLGDVHSVLSQHKRKPSPTISPLSYRALTLDFFHKVGTPPFSAPAL